MDPFYNEEKAVLILEEITKDRRTSAQTLGGVQQLGRINLDDLSIQPYGPKSLPFLCAFEDGEFEPAYIRVQGIIASKLLPPVARPNNVANVKRSRSSMRQAVTLTGLGCDTFNDAISGLEKVYLAFYNHLPEGDLLPLQGTTWNGHTTIEAYCRYFTHRLSSPWVSEHPIPPAIDPEGVLQSLCDGEFVYTSDNIVDYKCRTVTNSGTVRYEDCSPTQFKCGDIVEATLTFACLPSRDKKMKLAFILKALTLLNSDTRNEAAILQMRSRFPNFIRAKEKKRKATYTNEEELREAQTKMARMNIDDTHCKDD